MPVTFFDLSRVGVTKIARNDHQRHATHDCKTRPSVSQGMETRTLNLCTLTRGAHLSSVVGQGPLVPQQRCLASPADCELAKKRCAFGGQNYVACGIGFRLSN